MSYGIKAVNKDGISLIDENSKQVHISKSGSVLPGTLGKTDTNNNIFNEEPVAKGVIVPGEIGESLVFVRPRATSGSQTAATFCVHMGEIYKQWTSVTATVVGQSYILATPSGQVKIRPESTLSVSAGDVISGATSGASGIVIRSMTGNSSTYIHLRNCSGSFGINEEIVKNGTATGISYPSGTIGNPGVDLEPFFFENHAGSYCPYGPSAYTQDENYLVDTIGGLTGSQSDWASGNSNSVPRIIDIETTSTTGVYKLYLDGTWSSSLPAGTESKLIGRSVAIFAREFDGLYPSNHVLDYRFGGLDNEADESTGYGFELRDANGNLTYSSNRVNFQIEAITTGNADVVGNRDISGGDPFFAYEVNDPTNYQDYFALVASFGPSALCLEGGVATGGTRGYWLYSTGFSFSPPGYRPYDNATAGSGLFIPASEQKSSTSAGGIAHCAVAFARWENGPQYYGSYINEFLNHLSPRDLIIGKFI